MNMTVILSLTDAVLKLRADSKEKNLNFLRNMQQEMMKTNSLKKWLNFNTYRKVTVNKTITVLDIIREKAVGEMPTAFFYI